jgi:hypothetical protein
MARAQNPAYRRQFTKARNFSAVYFAGAIVKPTIERELGDLLPRTEDGKLVLPETLQWRHVQLGRAMSAASQMDRRSREIEVAVQRRLRQARKEHLRLKGTKAPAYPVVMAMEEMEFARWQYCRESARRLEETASRLEAQLFERLERLRGGETQQDLVAAMAAISEAEPVESEPPESEG